MSKFNRHGCSMPPGAGDHRCVCLEIDGALELDASAFAREVVESAEFYRDSFKTTVWIDVISGDPPAGLVMTLRKLAGFGPGVVITHEASLACSHAPGARLPRLFCDSVASINRRGFVWHPYAQQLVPAEP